MKDQVKSKATDYEKLVETHVNRRNFLKSGAALTFTTFTGLNGCSNHNNNSSLLKSASIFSDVKTNTLDTITLPEGYRWHPVISWGDPLFSAEEKFDPVSPTQHQDRAFGDYNDGMSLFNVDGKNVLVCNNESFNMDTLLPKGIKSHKDVTAAQQAMGVSIVELEMKGHDWRPIIGGKLNRRITALSSMIISGPAQGSQHLVTSDDLLGKHSLGTWGNCGNGKTPWGTYLTCEENFNLYYGSSNSDFSPNKAQQRYGLGTKDWKTSFHRFDSRFDLSVQPNEPNRNGYVVEINPNDPNSIPKKRTALGRFKHENAELVVNNDGHVVVYMGDDERGEFIYKFVSKALYNAKSPNFDILDHGTLYAGKFNNDGSGRWIELTHGKNGLTSENGFESQADICIFTRLAASQVGATTMDRPEWLASHPHKSEIYCSLTNNKNRGVKPNAGGDPTPIDGPNPRANNQYGQIIRWKPDNDDHTSDQFEWDLYVVAGNPNVHSDAYAGSSNINQENLFNSPDGLSFDPNGNLWIQTDGDISNQGDFTGMGNNQMLLGNTDTGDIKRFLVGPVGCEITGTAWSPDFKTLFIGIQHPTAHFPDGGNSTPRSTVIAIKRNDRGIIGEY